LIALPVTLDVLFKPAPIKTQLAADSPYAQYVRQLEKGDENIVSGTLAAASQRHIDD
jgi:hypothetical protein